MSAPYCTVCSSPDRPAIEARLNAGESLRSCEKSVNISRSALHRHRKQNHAVSRAVPSNETDVPTETGSEESAGHEANQSDVVAEAVVTGQKSGEGVAGKTGKGGLSTPQMRALQVLTRGETFTLAAQEAGVSIRTLYAWRRDCVPFRAHLASAKAAEEQVFEKRLTLAGSSAIAALAGLVSQPVQKGAEVRTKAAVALVSAQARMASRTTKVDVSVAAAIPMIVFPKGTLNPAFNTKTLPVSDPHQLAAPKEDVVDAELVGNRNTRGTEPVHRKGWARGRAGEASK